MPDVSSAIIARVDLNQTISKTILRDLFVTEDKNAHVFRVEITRGGEPVDLTGATVSGWFTRYKDNVSIPMEGGKIDGQNVAVLTMGESCYELRTMFSVTVGVSLGGVDHAVFVGEGQMLANRTDTILDTSGLIPSVDDIIAQYAEMKRVATETTDAKNAANTAAENANSAASTAQSAASTANTATTNANNATERANAAAQALEEAPVPTGTVSTYQAGTSPTTPPTGTWQSTIPDVPQGQYLWTRTVQSYTNGNPTTYYSVARQGIDGSGSVASVDGVSPDGSGNVQLGAVRSVNGSMPDEDGNVTIEAGGGDVQTVDGIEPDPETGDVPLNAANRDTYMLRLTAEEYEARTLAQRQQDYADGVRGYLVEGGA